MPAPSTQTEIEAAIYRKLIAHLRKHPDVQNIDLMNLAYFCRNCLAKWHRNAAGEHGVELTYEQAREQVYGMPYEQYKAAHQQEANDAQLREYEHAKHKASE